MVVLMNLSNEQVFKISILVCSNLIVKLVVFYERNGSISQFRKLGGIRKRNSIKCMVKLVNCVSK